MCTTGVWTHVRPPQMRMRPHHFKYLRDHSRSPTMPSIQVVLLI